MFFLDISSEYTMEESLSFQVYSRGKNGDLNFLVDKIWIDNNRIYFRILEKYSREKNNLKKESAPNVYSIDQEDIYSIRCRIYF